MKGKYFFILFIGLIILPGRQCFGQLSQRESGIITEFGKDLANDIRKDRLHGSISVAILKGDHIIWMGAFGYAKTNQDIAADTNTIYRVGSITKTFTTALFMQLVEEGKVKLDDAVEKYVPEIKSLQGYSGKTMITLRQLASHTSGLEREPDMPGANTGAVEEWENKVLSCIPHTSFNSDPGTGFLYSNIGFAILGLALERAAGVSYIQMVEQRIFKPLQMNDTFFSIMDGKLPRLAEGIDNNDEGNISMSRPVQEIKGRGYRVPNGGIFSTPRDLAKFIIALEGKAPLLKPISLKQMQVIPPHGRNYGLGLSVALSKEADIIGHNGSVAGYTSSFLIEQRSGYAVILMRNYNNGKTNLVIDSRKLLIKLAKEG